MMIRKPTLQIRKQSDPLADCAILAALRESIERDLPAEQPTCPECGASRVLVVMVENGALIVSYRCEVDVPPTRFAEVPIAECSDVDALFSRITIQLAEMMLYHLGQIGRHGG